MQRFQLVSRFNGNPIEVSNSGPNKLQESVSREVCKGNKITVFDRDTGGIFPVNNPDDIDDLPEAINGFAHSKVQETVDRIYVR